MGVISPDVRAQHLRINGNEEDVIKAVAHHFNVNYARRIRAAGTTVSAYLIGPDNKISQTFGFTDELLLVLSAFSNVQARSMQVIEQIYSEQPFKARANPLVYIFVSEAPDVIEYVSTYLMDHPQSRTTIPITWYEIASKHNHACYLRNTISKFLFTRDLFDYKLPLDEDLYFFGRTQVMSELLDSIRKSENRGLFGLRKTGKTSILYKVERTCNDNNIANVLYFNCTRADIRTKRWVGLLGLITDRIVSTLSIPPETGMNDGIIDRFTQVVRLIPSYKRVCVIFDEIEYISPLAKLDPHWSHDFIHFWQMLYAVVGPK